MRVLPALQGPLIIHRALRSESQISRISITAQISQQFPWEIQMETLHRQSLALQLV